MNCNVNTIFAIRDNAERLGLKARELVFLYTVESRGEAFCFAEDLSAEMGMSQATYYRVRKNLIEKGLLIAVPRTKRTTRYRVNAEALSYQNESQVSQIESRESHSESQVSQIDKTEENPKRTRKEPEEPSATSFVSSTPRDTTSEASPIPFEDLLAATAGSESPAGTTLASAASIATWRAARNAINEQALQNVMIRNSEERTEEEEKKRDREERLARRDAYREQKKREPDEEKIKRFFESSASAALVQ